MLGVLEALEMKKIKKILGLTVVLSSFACLLLLAWIVERREGGGGSIQAAETLVTSREFELRAMEEVKPNATRDIDGVKKEGINSAVEEWTELDEKKLEVKKLNRYSQVDGEKSVARRVVDQEKRRKILVYLTGAVQKPGLYEAEEGSHVGQVIEMAGGLREEAVMEAINQAALVEERQHIHVPMQGEGEKRAGNELLTLDSVVSLNRAGQAELETLPGVGPKLAKQILAKRRELGRFSSVDDLLQVSGLKSLKLEQLRPYLKLD